MRRPFSIVIVTWNSAREISGLMESINAHLRRPFELIFVENGSDDGCGQVIRERASEARLIELDENIGFGPGNNVGIRAASHDVVVMMNADVLLVDDSLADLADLARETGAICGPRLFDADGVTPQISAHPPLGSWQLAVSAVWPGSLMPTPVASRCDPWRANRRVRVGWLSAACAAAPRDFLLSLGPFDESFHFYGDDVDLGVRADIAGPGNIFAPDVARVIHLGERSVSRRFDDRKIAVQVETRAWLARQNLSSLRAIADRFVQIVWYGTRWAAKALLRSRSARRDRAYLQALLRGRAEPHGRR